MERALQSFICSVCRERRAGWYDSGTYLAHKLFEEIGLAVLMTLPFSCILYFPMQLHGTWTLFWLVYVVTSTIGIGEAALPFDHLLPCFCHGVSSHLRHCLDAGPLHFCFPLLTGPPHF